MRKATFWIAIIVIAFFASGETALANLIGPVWAGDLPGGGTCTLSDPTGEDMGRTDGLTMDFNGFDTSQFLSLFWGPAETGDLGLGLAMDGVIDANDEMATSFDFSGNTATWIGQTEIEYYEEGEGWLSKDVETKFDISVFDSEDNPLNFFYDDGLALGCLVDVYGAEEDNGFYSIVEAFAADVGGPECFDPFLDFYDTHWTRPENQALMSFNDGFFYSPIPEPTTVILLGAGLIGLAVLRRKIKK